MLYISPIFRPSPFAFSFLVTRFLSLTPISSPCKIELAVLELNQIIDVPLKSLTKGGCLRWWQSAASGLVQRGRCLNC